KGYIGTGFNGVGFGGDLQDFWEWNQGTDTWVQKANVGGGTRNSAVGFSIGGKGYIGTGGCYGCSTFRSDFWEWNPGTNTWTQKANFAGSARYGAGGFSIGAKGYIGTGQFSDCSGRANDLWEWDQAANAWTVKAG